MAARGRPRVAHVTTVAFSMRTLLLDQLRALADSGYEVAALCAPGPDLAPIEHAGIRVIPIPFVRDAFNPIADLRALLALLRVFRREAFTIVHTHTPKAGVIGQLAATLAGVPIVLNTIHGYYFHERHGRRRRNLNRILERLAASWSDAILFQNEEDLQTAVREGIGSRQKFRYLGNGIDLSRFDPAAVSPDAVLAARRGAGIPSGATVIGFVGRLVREKGLPDLFAAARRIRVQFPAACLLLVGPVDHEKPDAVTLDDARAAGVADMTHVVGMADDLPPWYAAMDVFVLPSWREGFPRTVMEASAMGIPCVVTDVRGCRQAVRHGYNGLIVPPGDAAALADAVLTVLADRTLARRLGEAGKALARERFDQQQVFATVKAEYTRLLRDTGWLFTEFASR